MTNGAIKCHSTCPGLCTAVFNFTMVSFLTDPGSMNPNQQELLTEFNILLPKLLVSFFLRKSAKFLCTTRKTIYTDQLRHYVTLVHSTQRSSHLFGQETGPLTVSRQGGASISQAHLCTSCHCVIRLGSGKVSTFDSLLCFPGFLALYLERAGAHVVIRNHNVSAAATCQSCICSNAKLYQQNIALQQDD